MQHRDEALEETNPAPSRSKNVNNFRLQTNLDSAPHKCDRAKVKNKAQLQFKKIDGWGGKRRGAGRKNKSSTVNHGARQIITHKTPLHITMKLKRGLNGLRTQKMLQQLKTSLGKAKAKGLRTIHFSLQSNHLHLFAESDSNQALASGMNSFGARFGREIRKRLRGSGSVFNGRYHIHILKTPRETRHALAYVLMNTSKHQGGEPEYDVYSSNRQFKEWRKLLGSKKQFALADGQAEPVPDYLSHPKSWLAGVGWKRSA